MRGNPGRPVVYLVNQYPAGSHTFIRREILALERQGHTVERVSIRRWDRPLVDPQDADEEKKTTYLLQSGAAALAVSVLKSAAANPGGFVRALGQMFRLYRAAGRNLPLHAIYFAEACWLSYFARQVSARHIHAHFGTNPAAVAMLAHLISGVPYSFTVHGYDEFDRPEAYGLGIKMAHAKAVVAISSYGRSQLMRWARVADWPKIAVVRCGLDREFYDAPTPSPNPHRLACVGRLCKEKAQLLLLESAALLSQQGIDFELVFVGDGEIRDQLESRLAELNLGHKVRITGWVSGNEVRAELLAATALVHPSFADGLPVVIMEAMALRRPVIACFVAGTPELVDNSTGWIVPAGSIDDLSEAIKKCLELPEPERIEMGARGRERVLARHQIDIETDKLAQVFAP